MTRQRDELLQQMLETEIGGIEVYETALQCALNPDLKREWREYLEQTKRHEQIVRDLLRQMGLTEQETPGRRVVRHIGASLVAAMKLAKQTASPEAAELVACECVVFAETKDHMNWELLGKCIEAAQGQEAEMLRKAWEEVEDEEDEHLYHSKGWCRELWLASLGMKPVLPPPEEQRDVRTAVAAARAQSERKQMT